jgi:hypothetical protein
MTVHRFKKKRVGNCCSKMVLPYAALLTGPLFFFRSLSSLARWADRQQAAILILTRTPSRIVFSHTSWRSSSEC